MRVGPPDSESTHARTARFAIGSPVGELGIYAERTVGEIEVSIWFLEMQGRRKLAGIHDLSGVN